MIDNAVYVDGKVALFFKQPIPKLIKVGASQYYFDCKFGVSLAFVEEADVPSLLGFLGGCCGGGKHVIFLASANQYSHWINGNGGR